MKILKDVYVGNLELTERDVAFIRNNFMIDGRIMKEGIKGDVFVVSPDFLDELKKINRRLHDKMFVWVNAILVFGPMD